MEFINLKEQYRSIKEEIDSGLIQRMEDASFIMGEDVPLFESELAEYVGVPYVISCGNGTDALQLAYMAHGIGKGDAIFCPDMTFIASVEPACLLGATPVFCDIDSRTLNISAESFEKQIKNVLNEGKLTPRVVVIVDFLGNPANFEKICKIAKEYDILIVEDGAQAMGAKYNDTKCCSFGDIATTSFFPSKPLGCYGDGGAVFTRDGEIANVIKSLRVHGKGKSKYDNVRIGVNSRLDTLQAWILRVKLKRLDEEIVVRQKVANKYYEELKDILTIPLVDKNCVSSYAQYAVCTDCEKTRDDLREYLKEKGVPTIVYYPNALHNLPVFAENNTTYGECMDNAVNYGNTNIGLPFSPYLTEDEQLIVIDAIKNYY